MVDHVSCFIFHQSCPVWIYTESVHHSTVTSVFYVFSYCHQFDAIYLDISKAFDSVSHSYLLSKLHNFNISGSLWLWLQAYLSNRSQFVSINNCYSNFLSVESGVPQGSILGPLLFIMFMNDLPNVIIDSEIFLFADDTKCFRHIRTSADQHSLQRDLDNLLNWSVSSRVYNNRRGGGCLTLDITRTNTLR